ncbi:FAD-dependent monooxygenase [Sphaerotilus sp.]|uniref:FAD-dependent monooxygenase n=1 Tax=Sphaerotilus sp. TaxID=2093942 RepID=UPI0034E2EF85
MSAATASDFISSAAPECVDVLIAGAGPTGLSTALALAPLGLRVLLVDPQDAATLADPPPDGRELALTYRTEALLRDWGLWDRLPDAARAPLHAAAVSTGGQAASLHLDASHARSTLSFPFPLPPLPRLPVPSILRHLIGPGAPGVASAERLGTLVSQNALRRALWQGCAECPERITVHERTRLEDFRRDADGVTVTLAGPGGARQVRASLLVAADGRLSGARRMAGLVADLHDFGRSAIVGRLRHTRPHDAVAREAFHLGHTLAVLPLVDAPDDGGTGRPLHQSSFVVTAPSELARQWMAQPVEDYARTVAGWLGGQLGDITPAPGDESRRHLYPLVATWAPQLVTDRVALVGDAAVGMHPVTAHGFNLGLYSAETLARHLKARAGGGVPNPADPVALAAYDREHRDTARWIFHGTNAIVRLFTDDRPAARLVRQATLHLAERLPPVKALIVRQLVDA